MALTRLKMTNTSQGNLLVTIKIGGWEKIVYLRQIQSLFYQHALNLFTSSNVSFYYIFDAQLELKRAWCRLTWC